MDENIVISFNTDPTASTTIYNGSYNGSYNSSYSTSQGNLRTDVSSRSSGAQSASTTDRAGVELHV